MVWVGSPRPNPRLQRTRSASPPSPLSRQPLGSPKRHLHVIAWTIVITACASAPPHLVEKPWHRSPSLPHDQAMLYVVVEWPAIRVLKVGMTEAECASALRVPVTFSEANTILYTTAPEGVEYEVALKTDGGKVVDISYKRRAA
jgi:hypothetical protein